MIEPLPAESEYMERRRRYKSNRKDTPVAGANDDVKIGIFMHVSRCERTSGKNEINERNVAEEPCPAQKELPFFFRNRT